MGSKIKARFENVLIKILNLKNYSILKTRKVLLYQEKRGTTMRMERLITTGSDYYARWQ